VYGHSWGGALALEAAARGIDMRKLAEYEPPYAGEDARSRDVGKELDARVRSGGREEAAERFLARTGMPRETIGHIKASPGWAGMPALAHTLSHDIALAEAVPDGHARSVDGQHHAPAHEAVASIMKEFFA